MMQTKEQIEKEYSKIHIKASNKFLAIKNPVEERNRKLDELKKISNIERIEG